MPSVDHTHQRTLADTAFGGDAGLADPGTRRALAAAQPDPAQSDPAQSDPAQSDPAQSDPAQSARNYLRAVAALCTDRLLVPVVATRTREAVSTAGVLSDKEAEMAVVLLQNAAGEKAMLAFTGTDSLVTWNGAARPVPVTLDLAARSALSDGAAALLVDVAGPHPLVIGAEVLTQLAAGRRVVELDDGGFGWAAVGEDAEAAADC